MERFGRNTLWLSLVIVGLVVIGALLGLEPRGGQMSAGELAAPASASSGAGSSGDEVVVELKGMRFTPAEIHVTPGTTIRFVNRDPITHNVVNARPETLGRERELFRSPRSSPAGAGPSPSRRKARTTSSATWPAITWPGWWARSWSLAIRGR